MVNGPANAKSILTPLPAPYSGSARHKDATRPDLAPDLDETAAILAPPVSAQRRLPGLDRDLGVSQLLEDAVLASVRERIEKETVERAPDSPPHEYPPGGVEHEVGVAGSAHQVADEDHQKVSDDDDGNPDPQRRETIQTDRAPLAPVVADALIAVSPQRHADSIGQAIAHFRCGQRELQPDRAPGAPRPKQADAVLGAGEEV